MGPEARVAERDAKPRILLSELAGAVAFLILPSARSRYRLSNYFAIKNSGLK
jgi:hypothetical protein